METTFERIRRIQKEIDDREQQERNDLYAWIRMPAIDTMNDIDGIEKYYGKRKAKTPLFVVLRVITPIFDNKSTWRVWLEVHDDKGKVYDDYKRKASAQYAEMIFSDKSWKEQDVSDTLAFFSRPLNNPISQAKPRVRQPKLKRAARATIWDLTEGSVADNMPEWMKG